MWICIPMERHALLWCTCELSSILQTLKFRGFQILRKILLNGASVVFSEEAMRMLFLGYLYVNKWLHTPRKLITSHNQCNLCIVTTCNLQAGITQLTSKWYHVIHRKPLASDCHVNFSSNFSPQKPCSRFVNCKTERSLDERSLNWIFMVISANSSKRMGCVIQFFEWTNPMEIRIG